MRYKGEFLIKYKKQCTFVFLSFFLFLNSILSFAYLTILVFLFKMSKRLRNRMEERELDE